MDTDTTNLVLGNPTVEGFNYYMNKHTSDFCRGKYQMVVLYFDTLSPTIAACVNTFIQVFHFRVERMPSTRYVLVKRIPQPTDLMRQS
jgi:hypothetical protein